MTTEARSRGNDDTTETEQAGERQSLKVKIPSDYHTKLHSIKVLTGKTISSTITEALREYLEEVEVESEAEPA